MNYFLLKQAKPFSLANGPSGRYCKKKKEKKRQYSTNAVGRTTQELNLNFIETKYNIFCVLCKSDYNLFITFPNNILFSI